MIYLRILFVLPVLLWIANCGGETVESVMSVAPTQAFVLNVDRNFIIGDNFITIPKPNTQFQIKIDNKGSAVPLTIIGLTLTVDGPTQKVVIPVDPFGNLFQIVSSINIQPIQRAIFAEVPAYQASFCMDKVTYLKRADTSESCSTIAADDVLVNIPNYGVSAAGTTDDSTSKLCCPGVAANLQNIFVLVGGLQTVTSDAQLIGTQTYNITADFFGYYGSIIAPISNFNQKVTFSAKSF